MTRPSPEELRAAGAPVLYSPEEAAEILPGKTAYWLRKNARTGAVPHTRIGQTIMFTPEDLSEIVRRGARKPEPVPSAVTPITSARRKTAKGEALQPRVPRRKRGAA